MSATAPSAAANTEQTLQEIATLLDSTLTVTVPLTALSPAPDAQTLSAWVAAVRGKKGRIRHPRIALFTARESPRLDALRAGQDPLCALAEDLNADLQVYQIPAGGMGNADAQIHTLTYGMMAVQPGLDALAVAVLDHSDESTGWPKTLDDVVKSDRAELAALLGAVIAARLARVPVVLAGAGASAATAILERHAAENAAHCCTAEALDGTLSRTGDAAVNAALAMARLKISAAL